MFILLLCTAKLCTCNLHIQPSGYRASAMLEGRVVMLRVGFQGEKTQHPGSVD